MFTVSRFAKTSMLVLLTATLTTAAYARGGGHSGSNGSMGPAVHSSAVHSSTAIVSKHGGKTLPNGSVAGGCPWSPHHGCHHHYLVDHPPVAPQGAAK